MLGSLQPSSLADLIRALRNQASVLIHQEVELAKAEIAEKTAHIADSLRSVALGAACLVAGTLALFSAVIYGLIALLDTVLPLGVAVWLAPLLVGLGAAGFGYSRLNAGIKRLKQESLTPHRTVQSLQENKQWLQTRMH
jgi:hypothetical protein